MAKPIVLLQLYGDLFTSEQLDEITSHIKEYIQDDYYLIPVNNPNTREDGELVKMEVFYEKDINDIKIEGLKQYINTLMIKNKNELS